MNEAKNFRQCTLRYRVSFCHHHNIKAQSSSPTGWCDLINYKPAQEAGEKKKKDQKNPQTQKPQDDNNNKKNKPKTIKATLPHSEMILGLDINQKNGKNANLFQRFEKEERNLQSTVR